jgi:DNA-binding PadR family transcriptional regulator
VAHLVSAHVAVLQALAAGPCWNDGIRERVREATGGAIHLSRGNVSPAIQALVADGLIEPAGEQPRRDLSGMPRRLYRLTEQGMLEAERQRKVMLAVIGMGGGRPVTPGSAEAEEAAQRRPESDAAPASAPEAEPRRFVVLDDAAPEGDG